MYGEDDNNRGTRPVSMRRERSSHRTTRYNRRTMDQARKSRSESVYPCSHVASRRRSLRSGWRVGPRGSPRHVEDRRRESRCVELQQGG